MGVLTHIKPSLQIFNKIKLAYHGFSKIIENDI